MILPGRGGLAPLDDCSTEENMLIKKNISEYPQNLRNVRKDISEKLRFKISQKMFRRFIKKSSIIHRNV